jgi:hypothetical protein
MRDNAGTYFSIVDATDDYESSLRRHTKLVELDLAKKHKKMRKDAFVFRARRSIGG